jgi:hypothetical protein
VALLVTGGIDKALMSALIYSYLNIVIRKDEHFIL